MSIDKFGRHSSKRGSYLEQNTISTIENHIIQNFKPHLKFIENKLIESFTPAIKNDVDNLNKRLKVNEQHYGEILYINNEIVGIHKKLGDTSSIENINLKIKSLEDILQKHEKERKEIISSTLENSIDVDTEFKKLRKDVQTQEQNYHTELRNFENKLQTQAKNFENKIQAQEQNFENKIQILDKNFGTTIETQEKLFKDAIQRNEENFQKMIAVGIANVVAKQQEIKQKLDYQSDDIKDNSHNIANLDFELKKNKESFDGVEDKVNILRSEMRSVRNSLDRIAHVMGPHLK